MFISTIQTFSKYHRSSLRLLHNNSNTILSSITHPFTNKIMSNNSKKQATLARFFTSIKKTEPTLEKEEKFEPIQKSNARVSEMSNESPLKNQRLNIHQRLKQLLPKRKRILMVHLSRRFLTMIYVLYLKK